jgi:hypothetical protein
MMHQLRAAVVGEDRRVEAKTGTHDHPVVGQIFLDLVRAREAHRDQV